MNIRLILLVISMILFAETASAQFTYYRQGFGLSTQYTTPILDKLPTEAKGEFKAYSQIGAAVHYAIRFELTPNIYLGTGISYGRTNYELSYNNSTPSNPTQIRASLHNTVVPVTAYFFLNRKKKSLLIRKWKPLAFAGIQLQTIKGARTVTNIASPETSASPYIFSYRPSEIQFGPGFSFGFAVDSPLKRNNLWQIFASANFASWDSQNFSLTYASTTSPNFRSFISPNFISFQIGVTYFPFANRMYAQYANPKPEKYKSGICPYEAPSLRKPPRQSIMD
ncbi:MAG: hypothetical protein ACOVMN_09255 [Flexibacteraceae bacterium]